MFKDCLKTSFKCSDTIKEKDVLITELNLKITKLTEENQQLKYMLTEHEHYELKYKGLPSMDEMIKDGRAKKFDQEELRAQWKKQFGLILSWGTNPANWGKTVTEWHKMDSGNIYPMWRIPKKVFEEWVKRSPVDTWTYDKDPSLGDTDDERSYMCMRFSLSMLGERYCSPYYDMAFGMVWIFSHSLNFVWFSDDEQIYYFEPQADGLRVAYTGNLKTDMQRPKELWL